ncbi:MAG: hypothetical protein FWH48_08115 [Oscillospiraceae bacterium]|nr:hypothetical protein [Oscillospiraceae bacterium]
MAKKAFALAALILLAAWCVGCVSSKIEQMIEPQITEGRTSAEIHESTEFSGNDHIEHIKNGDFSNIKLPYYNETLDEYYVAGLETLEINYQSQKNDWEWIERDINGNGTNELILREKDLFKAFIAIFSFENDEAKIIYLWNGSAHFYEFWANPGYYVKYQFFYGLYSYNSFQFYKLNNNYDREFVYGLIILNVYDFAEVGDEWLDNNPYIKENGTGIYCQEFYSDADEPGEISEYAYISEDQFLSKFKEMVGFDFYDIMRGQGWF